MQKNQIKGKDLPDYFKSSEVKKDPVQVLEQKQVKFNNFFQDLETIFKNYNFLTNSFSLYGSMPGEELPRSSWALFF